MDELIGYLIGGALILWIAYLILVYVIIPCFMAAVAICLVLGVIIGLWNTAYNYVEAINEVMGGRI